MKSYDNTIKYYELLMYYKDTSIYKKYSLPDGFHFEFYKDGNMNDWINIHIESGEFCAIEEGIMIFHDFYDTFIQELNKRCIFIVDDKTNEKVGTATVSLLSKEEFGYNSAVDWVAIKKDYQGKGLAKPLITKILEIANELEHKDIILHTQTTTWLAAKLYLDFGFNILNKNEKNGWNILKTLTNHPKLNEFETLKIEEVYDKRNVEIEAQLNQIFKDDNFNYSVWYKNGLHNVYIYYKNSTYEYEYFDYENKIILKEVENKKYKRQEVIKMDMYQKRKMRAEKKNNGSQESFPSVGINWESTNYLNTSRNY